MIGLKILGLSTLSYTSVALIIVSLLLTLMAGSTIEIVNSTYKTLSGAEIDYPVIIQSSARSLYTSIVPARVVDELRSVLNINARPIVAALAYVEDVLTPVWMLEKSHIEQYSPNIAILGSELAKRLNRDKGDIIIVSSLYKKSIHLLKVREIIKFGDQRDWYLFTSEEIIKQIRGLTPHQISGVILPSVQVADYVSSLLKKQYYINISYKVPSPAILKILASDGSIVNTSKLSGEGKELIKLGFGVYSFIISTGINDILIKKEAILNDSSLVIDLSHPAILTLLNIDSEPILVNAHGKEFHPIKEDKKWIFRVEPATYKLFIGNETYYVPLLGNATIQGGFNLTGLNEVIITVKNIDGSVVNDYYATIVRKNDSRVLVSTQVFGKLRLQLKNGNYLIRASIGDLIFESEFTVDTERTDVDIVIPLGNRASNIKYVSPLTLSVLGSGQNVVSILGLLFLSAEVLTSCVTVLLGTVTIYAIISMVMQSSKERIKELFLIGFSRRKLIKKVLLPYLLANSFLSIIGSLIAIQFMTILFFNTYFLRFFGTNEAWYILLALIANFIGCVIAYFKTVSYFWKPE